MNKIKIIFYSLCLASLVSGCTLFGLDMQEDYNHPTHTLSPNLNETAWDYMKSRNYITVTDTIINGTSKLVDTVKINDVAILAANYKTVALSLTSAKPIFPVGATVKFGKVLKVDTTFTLMLKGIRYSGIDTNLYRTSDRTLVLLKNEAIQRISGGKPYADCFFGAVLVSNKVATKWTDYNNKDFVKNYFKYLILMGQHNHYTIPSFVDSTVSTQLAKESLATYFYHLPTGITQPGGTPTGSVASGTVPAFIDAGTGATPIAGSNNGTIKIQVLNSSPSNTSDYPVQLNDYLNVVTSDLFAYGYDNGGAGSLVNNSVTVHVIDRFLPTNIPF